MIRLSRFIKIFCFVFCIFFALILLITFVGNIWNMFLYDLVKYLILGTSLGLYVAALSEIFLAISEGIDKL